MTLTAGDLETLARSKMNATGDTFWSGDEFNGMIWAAQKQAAVETKCIEGFHSFTTSATGTRAYSFPTNFMSLFRVCYDGKRLERYDFLDDDAQTGRDEDTTATGTPEYYAVWGNQIYLRPVPGDASGAITAYGYKMPATVTTAASMEIPAEFEHAIVDYLLAEMNAKNQNIAMSQYYMNRWDGHLAQLKDWMRERRGGDQYEVVHDYESLSTSRRY